MTKQECLLSVKDLEKNNFPLPSQLQTNENGADTSGYLVLCEEVVADQEAVDGYPLFALDCEMVETREGLELARVSLVDEGLRCVYDKLVRPDNPVLDYKTRFSGVTEDTLREVSTSLADVQADLALLLPPTSILIGHSLENDLHALKMVHLLVIDTSCLFQGRSQAQAKTNFKPKLQLLAKRLLKKEIQVGSGGHSSVQDAQACMELVLKKMRQGETMSLKWKGHSVLTEVAAHGRQVAIVDRASITTLYGPGTTECPVSTDEEVLEEAREAVPTHDLTFLQFHSYEDYLKTTGDSSPPHMAGRVLRQLDSEAAEVAVSCPPGTLVLVVCGSSDIRRMKSLQQRQETERLRELVAVARTGLAHAFIT
jgi:RNA exonuclease 1